MQVSPNYTPAKISNNKASFKKIVHSRDRFWTCNPENNDMTEIFILQQKGVKPGDTIRL